MSDAEAVAMVNQWCAERQKKDMHERAAYEKRVAVAKRAKENKRMEFYKDILAMGLSILSFVVLAVLMAVVV